MMKKTGAKDSDATRHKPGVYVVKDMDTLKGIAERIYRDPDKWREIAAANRIENPRLLTPGTVLTLPDLDE